GATEEARADATRFATYTDEGTGAVTVLEALVAIHSGRAAAGLAQLESTLPEHMTHPNCLYLYSRAYAVAARAGRDPAMAGPSTDRAVALLKDAIVLGFAEYSVLCTEPDLELVRSHPEFRRLFGPIDLTMRYAGAWRRGADWESREAHGLTPDLHLARCR